MDYKIIDVTPANVGEYDLFCKKSKSKEPGYQGKLAWFKKHKPTIKLLHVKEPKGYTSRGFIEYTPIEKAWRAVKGKGYMFIQCIWVVGKWKNKGLGTKLLNECIKDAKKQGMNGVVMLTQGKWLAKKNLFLKNGFKIVDSFETFDLLVKKFKEAPNPKLPDYKARAKKYGKGLTVIRTPQCPYVHDATETVKKYAAKRKIPFKMIELKTPSDVQKKSPTPYGTYALVKDGEVITYCYQLEKDLIKILSV